MFNAKKFLASGYSFSKSLSTPLTDWVTKTETDIGTEAETKALAEAETETETEKNLRQTEE